MTTRPNSKDSFEGMVKIVGLNHGLCLQTFLSKDGWKEEKFVDVVFLCMSHSNDETATSTTIQSRLKANRSVLAAASPFFAKILPDYQQEDDFFITVEYTYEELFAVLEYVYSGRLVCSEEKKEQILGIISELKISMAHSEGQKYSEIPSEGDCCIVQPVETNYGKDNVNKSQSSINATAVVSNCRKDNENISQRQSSVISEPKINTQTAVQQDSGRGNEDTCCIVQPVKSNDERDNEIISQSSARIVPKPVSEKVSMSKTYTKLANNQPTKSTGFPSMNLKIFSNKKNAQRTALCAVNKQSSANLPLRTGEIAANDLGTSGFTLTAPMDSQSTTYDAFDEEMGLYTSAELLNDTQVFSVTPWCNLLDYVIDTWECGVYSPVRLVELFIQSLSATKRNSKNQKVPENSTTSTFPETNSHARVSPGIQIHSNSERSPAKKHRSENSTTSTFPETNSHTRVSPGVQIHSNSERNPAKKHRSNFTEDIIVPDIIENCVESPRVLVPYVSNDYSKAEALIVEDAIGNSLVEDEADYTDLALAQHFLNEEKRIKKKRQMRVRMLIESLNQYKEISRRVLSTKRKLESQKSAEETKTPRRYTKQPRTRCETCGRMIITKKIHIHQLIHSDVKSHLCDHCGRAFTQKKYLYNHIRAQHRELEKKFICSTCGSSFKWKKALEVHERIHSGERPCVCKYCDKTFRESGSLARHLRIHTGEKPYACNICGTAYSARDTYVQHYRRRHTITQDGSSSGQVKRCDTCGKTFHRLLAYEQHRATHTGAVVAVRCSQPNCTFTYSDIAQLKDHMSSAHPEKTYICSICPKMFLSKPALLEHEIKHDSSKHFRCSMCPKIVTTKKSLVDHEKTHTRETPYECPMCDAKFHSPYLINIHMRKHEPPGRRKRVRKRAENSAESEGMRDVAE